MAIPEWLKITPTTGIGDRTLTLSPDENTGTGQREYVLTAETGYGVQATCRVIQEGAEEFIEITSNPENLDSESVLFQVQCRTNAETLLFTLPDEISVEAIITPDGQHISPGIEFDVPENPGEAGSFNFRVVCRLPEVNNTVTDEEHAIIIGTGAGATAECKVTRQGRAVIAENFTESISIPAAGGSIETEEMSLEVHSGIKTLGVTLPVPLAGSFASLLTTEISLKVSTLIAVKPGGEVSTMADIGEIVSPFIWTEWKPVGVMPTGIDITGRAVYGYKLRITAPENESTTDIREATVPVTFNDVSGQISGNSIVELDVTQEKAEPKKISGSTSVTVKNSTSVSKEAGAI